MRIIAVTAALALAVASAGAAGAQQHRDRSGSPGQGPAPSAPSAPAAPAVVRPEARPVPAIPGEAEIVLYTGANSTGANRLTGAYPDVSIGGVHSVTVNGQTWRICSGPNYTGACVNLSQSVANFPAFFGPPIIRSLKRIDAPRAAAPVVAAGGSSQGGQGQGGYSQGGYGQGGQGRPSYGQDSSGGYGQGGQGRPSYGQGAGGDWAAAARTVRYLCSGGTRLTAAFDDRAGSVQIRTDREGPLTLRQSPSRSGFLYQGASRSFSGRGDQATYAIGGDSMIRCQAQ